MLAGKVFIATLAWGAGLGMARLLGLPRWADPYALIPALYLTTFLMEEPLLAWGKMVGFITALCILLFFLLVISPQPLDDWFTAVTFIITGLAVPIIKGIEAWFPGSNGKPTF